MSRKKVLFIASWYPDEISPVQGVFIEDQAIELSKSFDVLVVYINALTKKSLSSGQIWLKGLSFDDRSGVKILRRNLYIPYKFERIFFPAYFCLLKRIWETDLEQWGRPDIIHAQVALPAGWAAVKIGKPLNIPVVLTEHLGPFSDILKTSNSRKLVRETLRGVDQIIAVSPALANDIFAFEPSTNIKIVGNLVRSAFFTHQGAGVLPLKARRKFRLLCIASLTQRKGIAFLLEALSRVKIIEGSHIELVVVGSGPDLFKLKAIVQKFELEPEVRFVGEHSRIEIRNYLQWCDTLILPSLIETFGLVLAEAMACGKPVISTSCGGPEFVVTPQAGILVAPGNVGELAKAIQYVMHHLECYNPETIRTQVSNRFGETAFTKHIKSIYEETWS